MGFRRHFPVDLATATGIRVESRVFDAGGQPRERLISFAKIDAVLIVAMAFCPPKTEKCRGRNRLGAADIA
jgi:hypothetical protein